MGAKAKNKQQPPPPSKTSSSSSGNPAPSARFEPEPTTVRFRGAPVGTEGQQSNVSIAPVPAPIAKAAVTKDVAGPTTAQPPPLRRPTTTVTSDSFIVPEPGARRPQRRRNRGTHLARLILCLIALIVLLGGQTIRETIHDATCATAPLIGKPPPVPNRIAEFVERLFVRSDGRPRFVSVFTGVLAAAVPHDAAKSSASPGRRAARRLRQGKGAGPSVAGAAPSDMGTGAAAATARLEMEQEQLAALEDAMFDDDDDGDDNAAATATSPAAAPLTMPPASASATSQHADAASTEGSSKPVDAKEEEEKNDSEEDDDDEDDDEDDDDDEDASAFPRSAEASRPTSQGKPSSHLHEKKPSGSRNPKSSGNARAAKSAPPAAPKRKSEAEQDAEDVEAATRAYRHKTPHKGANYAKLKQNMFDRMPSADNADDAARMRCSACRATQVLVERRLAKVLKNFERQPSLVKEYHLLQAVEGMCDAEADFIGLRYPHGSRVVSTVFADERDAADLSAKASASSASADGGRGKAQKGDKEFGVVKGGWVGAFYVKECEDVMGSNEDALVPLFKGNVRGASGAKKVDFCLQKCKPPRRK